MKKRALIYIYFMAAIGVLLALKCCYDYLVPFFLGTSPFSLLMFLLPLVVCALCRSLPITVRENETLDLSVISVLAIYLTQGAAAAVSIYILSSLFTFEPSENGKKYKHLFTIGAKKVLFNDATIILSILIPNLIIRLCTSWAPGDLSMPAVVMPTVLFSLLTFVINTLLQLAMFSLNSMITPSEAIRILFGLTPNVIAAMPLGLLLSYGYSYETSMWVIFLMLSPLLLARYAWKLYIDSENARSRLITAFIHSIEAKDKYTQGHSERVAAYSVQIAQQMKLNRKQIQLLRQGAVLHDIGKIGISDVILNKPDRLTSEEYAAIQTHPLIGVRILEEVGLEDEVLELVRSHHERIDGRGYPDQRSSRDLSLATRILCVADAYDAMTSDRPYRKGMTRDQVYAILNECKGTQFDPDVVDALIKSLEK